MAYYTYKEILYKVTPEWEAKFKEKIGEEFEGTADYNGDIHQMAGLMLDELQEKVRQMEEQLALLDALQECGVDNWDGYGDAHILLDTWSTHGD